MCVCVCAFDKHQKNYCFNSNVDFIEFVQRAKHKQSISDSRAKGDDAEKLLFKF